ncbi:hypothetical protein PENSPDRAFT_246689 [Peniophora sp. CONT]|nr:hypothetical protein PENSPDRAFT_246689 [Peniophora sp. CONT]
MFNPCSDHCLIPRLAEVLALPHMAFRRFNGIPHPLMYAALIPVESDLGLPGFDLLMPQKEFTVGRGEHNDICVRGTDISDEHCKLVWKPEKKAMFVEWLPTTNGTWIRNNRHECHRLKRDEAFPLFGEISFAPVVDRYGKTTGPNDYLYTFRIYSEHEMEEQLEPEELVERKNARARFKTARLLPLLGSVSYHIALHLTALPMSLCRANRLLHLFLPLHSAKVSNPRETSATMKIKTNLTVMTGQTQTSFGVDMCRSILTRSPFFLTRLSFGRTTTVCPSVSIPSTLCIATRHTTKHLRRLIASDKNGANAR